MAFDAHKNFAYGTVLTAPAPATSGTVIVLGSGQGALFPAPPFNITIWPSGVDARSSNAEIARCTSKATDTLTIARAQEGSVARAIIIGDQVAATLTAKSLTDIETRIPTATKDATYWGTPGATPFLTVLSAADDTTVLFGRTSAGITAIGTDGMFKAPVDISSGLTAFIAKWDEGTPSVYIKEYVQV